MQDPWYLKHFLESKLQVFREELSCFEKVMPLLDPNVRNLDFGRPKKLLGDSLSGIPGNRISVV
jgi:hypothetical protein